MDDEHINPQHTLYLSVPKHNLDGSIDGGNPDGWVIGTKVGELVGMAKDTAEEHGSVTYIYRCTPIRKVFYRGKTRVVKL